MTQSDRSHYLARAITELLNRGCELHLESPASNGALR